MTYKDKGSYESSPPCTDLHTDTDTDTDLSELLEALAEKKAKTPKRAKKIQKSKDFLSTLAN